ncbi:hypothetical protein V6N11_042391 [Hibiscus sabdariffa]|uniref:Uncharacterized protein n=1 Tax=Hibiscus sabdariffa TaxID=183260 RepID=A0ABR2QWT6_9ROSI
MVRSASLDVVPSLIVMSPSGGTTTPIGVAADLGSNGRIMPTTVTSDARPAGNESSISGSGDRVSAGSPRHSCVQANEPSRNGGESVVGCDSPLFSRQDDVESNFDHPENPVVNGSCGSSSGVPVVDATRFQTYRVQYCRVDFDRAFPLRAP